jgi:hypothetical protein
LSRKALPLIFSRKYVSPAALIDFCWQPTLYRLNSSLRKQFRINILPLLLFFSEAALKPLCRDTFFGGYLVVVGVCVGV